jgi:hypothetical protein
LPNGTTSSSRPVEGVISCDTAVSKCGVDKALIRGEAGAPSLHGAVAATTTFSASCVVHIRGGGAVSDAECNHNDFDLSVAEFKCGDSDVDESPKFDPVLSVPETLILRDWMFHHSLIRRAQGSCGIDKQYIEKAVRIALSLATILQKQHVSDSNGFMPEKEICIDNVLVITSDEDVQSDFVQKTILPRYGWGAASYSQRIAICNLGGIFFELFSLGDKPPRKDPNTTLTSVAPLSLEYVQKIIDEGDSQKSAKKHARREEKNEDEDVPYTLLQNAGMPHSICRLVSDMLENSGGLFSHDNSVASFSDAVSDLRQMVEKPKSFLYDALKMRTPTIPKKLYCRDDALKQCLDVAQQVVDSDSIFDRHSRSGIMLSGCSGSGKSRLVQEVSTRLEQKGWQYLYCKFDQAEGTRPMRKITSAIDRFLLDITFDRDCGEEIRSRITNAFNDDDLRNLFDVIPTLKYLVSSGNSLTSIENTHILDSESEHRRLDPVDVEVPNALASSYRMYRSIAMLLKSISSPSQPLLFCM